MRRVFYFLAIILLFLHSCKKGGYGPDCKGYDKGVARMKIPELSITDYNTVKTAFYRLGHWTSCRDYRMPLSVHDTLMVYGYITDTFHCEYYSDFFYKITEKSTKADNVPFVLLHAGDLHSLPDSTTQSIHKTISNNSGKRIYVRGELSMAECMVVTRGLPSEIIPGDWGDDGPWFSVPLILVRSNENIRFEN